MTTTTQQSEELATLLLAAGNDPMWARYAEIPKSILTKAADAIKELVQERDRLKQDKTRLRLIELLAVIHRDGGQYKHKVGIEQACIDAGVIVAGMNQQIEEVDKLIQQAVLAERDACADLCEDAFDKFDSNQTDTWSCGALYCAGLICDRSKK